MNPEYEPYWSTYLQQFADLPASEFQRIRRDTNKFCVIVEPRCHPLLIPVIKNFMYLLQEKGYGLIVYHGTANEQFLRDGLAGWPDTIHYVQMGYANLSSSMYNTMLKSLSFWEGLLKMGCEHALIFQTDVVLFKDTIDDYLDYDYVGAPWKDSFFGCRVGNGGFSLRRVETMLRLLTLPPAQRNVYGNEDGFFGLLCMRNGYNLPSVDVASTFSVETIYHPDPCGLHKPWLSVFPSYETYETMMSRRVVRGCPSK
jgi:hypothetical protein